MTDRDNPKDKPGTVLVVGATGSVGRHVVAEAVRQGLRRDLAALAAAA